jgi:hypothetical protein
MIRCLRLILIVWSLSISSQACEKLNPDQIKSLYFSNVRTDIENLGIICISSNSKNKNCLKDDVTVLQEKWDLFVKNSQISTIGKEEIENYSDSISCKYKIRVFYYINTLPKPLRIDESPPEHFLKIRSQKNIILGLVGKTIIDKNNWIDLNTETITANNSYGQEILISPIAMSTDYFRRFLWFNRVSKDPRLSSYGIRQIDRKSKNFLENDEDWKITKDYFYQNYR